jgi:hypothetical protein
MLTVVSGVGLRVASGLVFIIAAARLNRAEIAVCEAGNKVPP